MDKDIVVADGGIPSVTWYNNPRLEDCVEDSETQVLSSNRMLLGCHTGWRQHHMESVPRCPLAANAISLLMR